MVASVSPPVVVQDAVVGQQLIACEATQLRDGHGQQKQKPSTAEAKGQDAETAKPWEMDLSKRL